MFGLPPGQRKSVSGTYCRWPIISISDSPRKLRGRPSVPEADLARAGEGPGPKIKGKSSGWGLAETVYCSPPASHSASSRPKLARPNPIAADDRTNSARAPTSIAKPTRASPGPNSRRNARSRSKIAVTVRRVRYQASAWLITSTLGSLPVQIRCDWTPWYTSIRPPETVRAPVLRAYWMSAVSPPAR